MLFQMQKKLNIKQFKILFQMQKIKSNIKQVKMLFQMQTQHSNKIYKSSFYSKR